MTSLEEEKQKNYIFYPSDNSFNEKKKINFFVGGEIYIIEDEDLIISLTPLLNNIKEHYEQKKKCYLLPKFIDKISLDLFFNFIKNFNDEVINLKNLDLDIDFYSLRSIFNISLFFQYIKLIEILVKNYLIYQIDKDNCINIIKNYIDLLYNIKVKEIFADLIEKCFLYLNKHIKFFILKKKDELLKLSPETINEIIDVYFKYFYSPNNIEENKLIFWLLMYNRKINNDLFELLENERKYTIMNFETLHSSQNNLEKLLIWNIYCDNLNEQFLEHKESIIEGIKIRLISYYESNKDVFQLAMEIIEDEDMLDDSIDRKSNLNEKNLIISLLSLCEIQEIKNKSKMNFNCIFTSLKSKYLIFKLNNFRQNLKDFQNEKGKIKLTIHLYFSRNFIFPSILYQILINFKDYYSLNSISNLPRSALNLIFKNNLLKVISEDQKLIAILNWLNGKNNLIIENSIDLFKLIKWKKIKTDILIDFFINQGKLLSLNDELKNIIFQEFQRRFHEEYQLYNMTSLTESSMTNSSFITQSINKSIDNNDKNLYVNFTFNVLSKILSYITQFHIDDEKKNSETNSFTNDKNINKSQYNIKNKIPYTQKNSFRKDSNNLYSNFSVKKVNYSVKSGKILSARNLKEFPPNNKSKSKYTISNTNNSMLSNNNTSTISYKNNNTSIISNSKIEKSIINRVLNKGIRSNTPTTVLYDKNLYKFNKEKETNTFSITLEKEKKNLSSNVDSQHSKSVDKISGKNEICDYDDMKNMIFQRQINLYHPKYIQNVNTTSENNLCKTKSPKNINLYSLQNKENKKENNDSIPVQKSNVYYKMKLNQDTQNLKKRRFNNNISSSHLRSMSNL